MRPILVVLSALALFSLGACAGWYAAGDTGAHTDHHNFTSP